MEAIYWPFFTQRHLLGLRKENWRLIHRIAESKKRFFQKKKIIFLVFKSLIVDLILGLNIRGRFVSINGVHPYRSNLKYLYTSGMEIMILSLFLKVINDN